MRQAREENEENAIIIQKEIPEQLSNFEKVNDRIVEVSGSLQDLSNLKGRFLKQLFDHKIQKQSEWH